MLLRDFELRDLQYFLDALQDEEVTRFIGGFNSNEDVWRKMMTGSAQWRLTGIGMWAVEVKETGETVGHLGIFDFLRDMSPSMVGEPEMGWIFGAHGQGKGYAQEAGVAVLDWFRRHFGERTIHAIITPGNVASMKLAERLGFVRQPDTIYRDQPTTYWRRPAGA